MRVLAISNLFPPHAYGGYEMSCADVLARFRERGHDVTVLTSTATVPGIQADDDKSVRRDLVPWWDWQTQTAQPARLDHRLRIARHNALALRRALDDVRPDVVSVWQLGGLSLTLLTEVEARRIPYVVVVGDDWLVYGPRLDAWGRLFDGRRALGGVVDAVTGVPTEFPTMTGAHVAYVSECTRRRAAATRWRPASTSIVPPGIDTRDFPLSTRAPRAWQWSLLYVGRIEPEKGVETLIRAIPLLPADATLTCLGGGNVGHRRHMQQVVDELGLSQRVRFDSVPRAQLRDHYRAADVVVFPSEWEEPFGLVPLEAMACGTPVVATGTGGSGEFLVDEDNCLLFPAGDSTALAAAVSWVAADSALRDLLVAGGAATVARLTADRYADELLSLHERMSDAWH